MSRGVLTTISVYVIGILVILAGFFLLDFEKNTLNFWALGSLMFAIFVSMFVMISVVSAKQKKEGVFYRAGLSSAVWIYLIVIFISTLFAGLFKEDINSFIFLQIIINALFFIVTIVVISVSSHIHTINEKTAKSLQDGEYNTPKRGGF
jgi:Na+/proline symporter